MLSAVAISVVGTVPGGVTMPDDVHERTDLAPGQSLTARISNAIVGLHKEFYGKGPTKAKAIYSEDLVVVLLRGGFTKVEETLRAAGRAEAVNSQRREFQQAMRVRYSQAVAEITGREVIGFMSGNQSDPPMMVEVFVLAPRQGRGVQPDE